MNKPKRPRGTGCVYRQKGSANWWIQYYRNGRVYRQSSGTSNRRKAERLLQRKLGEIATHNFIDPRSEKTPVQELADDLLREYEINARKSLPDLKARWGRHLSAQFGELRAANVDSSQVAAYIAQRQQEGAKNATINREMAALKRMFALGVKAKKVYGVPDFPHLEERNVRKGFVEDEQYTKLATACGKEGLWMRALFEAAYNFGWRVSELLGLRVKQVDLLARTIRLEPGTTKNDEGRTVVMPALVYSLLQQCMAGKQPDYFVFTRANGQPVRDFRDAWAKVCCAAGLGQMICRGCSEPVERGKCKRCQRARLQYAGLIFHDLRRTAVRNMVRRGIPERVAMMISGHKTRSVFDRYNIVSEGDLREAARKMERRDYDYSSAIVEPVRQPVVKATKLN